MTKMMMAALLMVTTLAGCGQASLVGAKAPAAGIAARVNTSTKGALLKVPADVFAFMEDHYARLQKQYDHDSQTVHAQVAVVASRDHFKRDRHEVTVPAGDFKAAGTDRTVVLGMLNADIAPGEYEYYLVMHAQVVNQGKRNASLDSLDDFFVSNYGKNYRITLK